VSKHKQKAVINMAASRPSRLEIGQVESSRKIVDKSMKSIDKTAKSIVAFDSIDYGVYYCHAYIAATAATVFHLHNEMNMMHKKAAWIVMPE